MTAPAPPQTLYIGEVIRRLLDLRAFSPELARRMDHEEELPVEDDLVRYLFETIEAACNRFVDAQSFEETVAASNELAVWLHRSYRYYITRLVAGGQMWKFEFPRREEMLLQ